LIVHYGVAIGTIPAQREKLAAAIEALVPEYCPVISKSICGRPLRYGTANSRLKGYWFVRGLTKKRKAG